MWQRDFENIHFNLGIRESLSKKIIQATPKWKEGLSQRNVSKTQILR